MHFPNQGSIAKGKNPVKKRLDISDGMLESHADRFSTLGDATRLKILRQLMRDCKSTVTQVVERSGCALGNTSKQHKRLRDAGILNWTVDGVLHLLASWSY
jgi:predicted transcriptional regulator